MATAEELAEFYIDSARYGDLDDVVAALKEGVPVDAVDGAGRTALHMASANGHLECVLRILSAGAVRLGAPAAGSLSGQSHRQAPG